MLRNEGPQRAPAARPSGVLRLAVVLALCAASAATAVSADTLAQPKDDALERAASNYVRFREEVAAVEAIAFTNAEVTREAHRRLASHDPEELSDGWVAYAALVAADTPAFSEAVKKQMKRKRKFRGLNGGRIDLLGKLSQEPSYARRIDGADKAMLAVLAMTAQDGARIRALGEAFKAQAYALQKTTWGKKQIAPPRDRLNEVADYQHGRGARPAPAFEPTMDGGVVAPSLASAAGHWAADWGESAPTGKMSEANAQVIMDRVLNLAARYSSGALNSKYVKAYARNDKSNRCLTMARLTLKQCIAATRTPYEEAFCIGEHALIDTADCVGWIGGAGAS